MSTLAARLPDALAPIWAELLRTVEDAAERGAARGVARARQAEEAPQRFGIEGLAEMLGKKIPAARMWVYRHSVPHSKTGTRMLFERAEIEAFLAAQRRRGRAGGAP